MRDKRDTQTVIGRMARAHIYGGNREVCHVCHGPIFLRVGESRNKNRHFGQNFSDALRQGLCGFWKRIDHRIMYSTVARKPVFCNAIYAAATALLPLRWPVSNLPFAVKWGV